MIQTSHGNIVVCARSKPDSIPHLNAVRRTRLFCCYLNEYSLCGRIGELASDAAKQAKKVHETIRDKPYLFLASTLGIGIVLGKFLDWKRRRN